MTKEGIQYECKPHMRGDGPRRARRPAWWCWRKPHMRGDGPSVRTLAEVKALVNPTCVGMDRGKAMTYAFKYSKPHMRGDGPRRANNKHIAKK